MSQLLSHFQGGQVKLPAVPKCVALSERVWVALGMNPGPFSLQGTNTYLVGTGKGRILIDTGEGKPEYISVLRQALQESGGERITRVLLTHWHMDHIGGVPSVLKAFGDIPVMKFQAPEKDTLFPGEGAQDPDDLLPPGVIPLRDGEVIEGEGCRLRAIYTPGHANDHVCFHLEEENALFTGDNVMGTGTPVFRDLPLYLESLRRLKEVGARRLYTSHGPVVDNAGELIDEYIAHREKRVDQVRQVLEASQGKARTVEEVTRAIYSSHPEHLIKAAAVNTLQALRVLGNQGVAKHDAAPSASVHQLSLARWTAVARRVVRAAL
eukprot:Hpha_TRINITY_DN31611_c0_g1::TRINITY_DN31611_c0_g1_i1::g.29109::m.29109